MMYNGVDNSNARATQSRASVTHELDGVTFKVADKYVTISNQLWIGPTYQSEHYGKLDKYSYDFKLEKQVLQEIEGRKTANRFS